MLKSTEVKKVFFLNLVIYYSTFEGIGFNHSVANTI